VRRLPTSWPSSWRRLTATDGSVEVSWPAERHATAYRVILRDETTGRRVRTWETKKPRYAIPLRRLDRSHRYEWRPQAREGNARRWVDVLPPLRLPLPPPEGAAVTPLEWPDAGAPAYRVVIRDETADEIVIKDGVRGTRYLVNWAELYPAHRYRFRVQTWRGDGWIDLTPYRALYPPLSLVGSIAIIDQPERGATVARDPLEVRGWALCNPGTAVATVEIFVNGARAGRARLGQPRPELAPLYSHPDAPICGFAYRMSSVQLPADTDEVVIGALVHTLGGSAFRAEGVTARLEEPERPFEDSDGRAAQLRERVEQAARTHAPSRGERPRLLAFTHQLGYGGAQLYLSELLGWLTRESGFSCTVVAPCDGPLLEPLEASGISVHLTSGYGLSSVELYEGKLCELAAWAGSYGFDVVLANTVEAPPGIDLAARLGLPGVLAIHESVDFPAWSVSHPWSGSHRYVRERIQQGLGTAAAVVFAADGTRRQYVAYGDPARFLTMPYGVAVDKIASYRLGFDRSQARRDVGIPEEATVILCLGKIEARKAQASLAQAFAAVAADHPDSLLCMVGDSGGGYSAALRQYLDRVGLTQRVVITPVLANVYPWYGIADVLVCASDNESLPLSVLEAMAFETTVLATRIFGLPELLEDGRTGYLCEPRDVADLTSSLDRVLRAAPDERLAVAQAGAELVREHHDSRRYAEKLGRVLDALLDDPAALPREVLGV
jgi:D-inositol-3-phosphate glycosyltransferase